VETARHAVTVLNPAHSTAWGEDMAAPVPPTPPGTSQWGTLASWGDRVIAALVDGLIAAAAWVVVLIAGFVLTQVSETLGGLVFGLGYLALGLYFYLLLGYLEGMRGQSPGKALTGLQVVSDRTGGVLGGGMGIVRRLAHLIDGAICYIGYLFPLWDPKRQTIADKLLTTVVLRDREKRPFGVELFKP
jgi:uncharacterized RDD family membrane protein YckC